MSQPNHFVISTEDQVSVCFAYLSYIGETLKQEAGTSKKIYAEMNNAIPQVPILSVDGQADWQIVWGPAIYTYDGAVFQDSGMFVVQQLSQPENYVVAIRGTNSKALEDWLKEDLDVLAMTDWPQAANAKISNATNNGINILLDKLIPDAGLPAAGMSISSFLQSINDKAVKVNFTGHSLGGALAPTMALYFKQTQGQAGAWDPSGNVVIGCTSFAGATAGNLPFADYSNTLFNTRPCRRIHNTNDIVPHAWNKSTLEELKTLYDSAGIEMDWELKAVLDVVIASSEEKQYTQIDDSLAFTFPIDKSQGNNYFSQAAFQHDKSYPLAILGNEAGSAFMKLLASYP